MIAELYPGAGRHLKAAREAKAAMSAAWERYMEAGLSDVEILTYPGGSGRITIWADWPEGARAALTNLFTVCTDELRACLDSLVAESVAMFSVLKRPRAAERRRFFPITDSEERFKSLLGESCMDGVLETQFQLALDCQPFRRFPDDETAKRFRTGLQYLLDWSARLEAGSQVGAWVTPVDPELQAESPVELTQFDVLPAGPLDTERDVALYVLANYSGVGGASGRAGSYVDLAFPDGFDPADVQDTFDQRVNLAIEVAERIIITFALLAEAVPTSRRIRTPPDQAAAQSWVSAAQSARGWSNADLADLKNSDMGVGVVAGTSQLTLLVATADRVYERTVPGASPLSGHAKRGIAAEGAVRDAAATWGLPDFVLAPHVEQKGRGVREISDGLLLVGNHGLIVQVKSRDATPAAPDRETAWLTKKIAEGTRQAEGTARRLSSRTTDMTNGRGRSIEVNGGNVRWTGAVIIDHPAPSPGYRIQSQASRIPVVVLLRRDWEFLFDQLRSTRAVIGYLERVGGSAPVLGAEPERYYELAAADAAAKPSEIDPALLGVGVVRSVPLLPAAPAGSDDDKAHGLVRIMCEDIAVTRLEGHSETEPAPGPNGHRPPARRLPHRPGTVPARRTAHRPARGPGGDILETAHIPHQY